MIKMDEESKMKYLTCGAFDCLLSDSSCQKFSCLIGNWREFRPSSSWVFGSWEVASSGTAEGTEYAAGQYLNVSTLTPNSQGMYSSFGEIAVFSRHTFRLYKHFKHTVTKQKTINETEVNSSKQAGTFTWGKWVSSLAGDPPTPSGPLLYRSLNSLLYRLPTHWIDCSESGCQGLTSRGDVWVCTHSSYGPTAKGKGLTMVSTHNNLRGAGTFSWHIT